MACGDLVIPSLADFVSLSTRLLVGLPTHHEGPPDSPPQTGIWYPGIGLSVKTYLMSKGHAYAQPEAAAVN